MQPLNPKKYFEKGKCLIPPNTYVIKDMSPNIASPEQLLHMTVVSIVHTSAKAFYFKSDIFKWFVERAKGIVESKGAYLWSPVS